ncbi:helix-turn-helix domain-containing protein [Fodinibius halophilus]|uniref:Helix-turn-helix domain-containing protein n=1 Tax=Fodinibius halophilus TaxID=1736908 RepID=A0A6M1T4H9_9BACT|nr:helix-turn-helix domain-containing protein [Fodinibius halophilus]NGP87573.1 helix-turn-helix domain-containing protein [Fodinibius halophilus]
MQAYIQTEEQLKEAVAEAVAEILDEKLPTIIRKSKRSEYLTTKELNELTGWSYRTQKKLRDKRLIPFSQHGRKIVYPTEGIEEFLRDNEIQSKTSDQ